MDYHIDHLIGCASVEYARRLLRRFRFRFLERRMERRPPRNIEATDSEQDPSGSPSTFSRRGEPTATPLPPTDTPETRLATLTEVPARSGLTKGSDAISQPSKPGPAAAIAELLPPALRAEWEALEALYQATDGQGWINAANWLSGAPVSAWYGVETDGEGHVISLVLSDNHLSGFIPTEIAGLSRLEVLNIGSNQLRGRLPAALADYPTGLILTATGNRLLTGCISDELRQKLSEDSQPGLPDCESQPSRASNDQSTPADARWNLEVRIVGIARDAALEEMPPGEQIWLDTRVANNGFGDSAATTLRYYRSNDDTISARDAQIGVDQVASLESGRSAELSFRVTAPNSPGTYYYGACVDAVSGDTDPSNDCSGSVETIIISQETARETNPDLVLRNLRRVGSGAQQAVHVGQALTFQADVENIADASSRSSTIRFYRSTDSNITTGDAQVGAGGTGIIWPGRNSSQTISLTAHTRFPERTITEPASIRLPERRIRPTTAPRHSACPLAHSRNRT